MYGVSPAEFRNQFFKKSKRMFERSHTDGDLCNSRGSISITPLLWLSAGFSRPQFPADQTFHDTAGISAMGFSDGQSEILLFPGTAIR